MGCFGINGCISKLPVVYQDKCFLMIGVSNKKETQTSPFSFGTGFLFAPIALPVFGQYNDYGCVDEIVRNKILNVNPNFNEGIYRITEYYDSYVLMQVYKKTYTKVLLDDLGDEYVKFLNFFYKMKALDWNLVIHNYTGQDGRSNVVALKDYYQDILSFVETKINLF